MSRLFVRRPRLAAITLAVVMLAAGSLGVAGYAAWQRWNTNGCVSWEPVATPSGPVTTRAGECDGYMTPREVWEQAGTPGQRL